MTTRTVRRRYQGREVQSTIQAPTLRQLNAMIGGMRSYARNHRLGPIKVLSEGKDPDGGYKAVVSAHNWNPLKWVKEKYRRFGRPSEEELEERQRKKEKEFLGEESEYREEEVARKRRLGRERLAAGMKAKEFETEELKEPAARMRAREQQLGYEQVLTGEELAAHREARKAVREEEREERKKREKIEREQAIIAAKAERDKARARAGLPITRREKILGIFAPGQEPISYTREGVPITRRREGIARRVVKGTARGAVRAAPSLVRAAAPSRARRLRAPAPRMAPRVSPRVYRPAPTTIPRIGRGPSLDPLRMLPSISPRMLIAGGGNNTPRRTKQRRTGIGLPRLRLW